MGHIESKISAKVPVERAFDYIADPANRLQWLESVLEVKNIAEGPIGVGTSWTEVLRIAGRTVEQVRTVMEYERPRRYVYEFTTLGAKSGKFDITFEPEAGGTRIVIIVDYILPGSAFGKIADKLLFERSLKKSFGHSLTDLRTALESGQAESPE
jgi:uncharacterized protein YndB with AHSA1/START domain